MLFLFEICNCIAQDFLDEKKGLYKYLTLEKDPVHMVILCLLTSALQLFMYHLLKNLLSSTTSLLRPQFHCQEFAFGVPDYVVPCIFLLTIQPKRTLISWLLRVIFMSHSNQ